MHPAITTLAAVAFFMLLHIALERVKAPFHVRLKLSRGLASVVLVAMGFYALIRWRHLWPVAFLAPHEKDTILYDMMFVFIGHFLADFIWLVYGRLKEGSKPRPDLILHHVMGLLVVWFSLSWEAGYAIVIICLTTEMMPMTTGLNAWGQVARSPRVERIAWKLRLAVLWGWRMPLWIFEIVIITRNLLGEPGPKMTVVFWIGLVTAVAFFFLDVYWSRKALRTLQVEPA